MQCLQAAAHVPRAATFSSILGCSGDHIDNVLDTGYGGISGAGRTLMYRAMNDLPISNACMFMEYLSGFRQLFCNILYYNFFLLQIDFSQ